MFCLTLLPDEVFIEFARLLDVGNCLGGWLFDLCVGSGGVRGVMFYCLFVYLCRLRGGEVFPLSYLLSCVVYSTQQCWFLFLIVCLFFSIVFAGFSMLPVRASTPSLSSWRLT